MFQHFIITPFSYRSSYHTKKRRQDPLKANSLEHRFKMFETTCLPSVLSQKNKDFTWVLIIDRALPNRFLSRLKKLTSNCRNVRLHVHKNETHYGNSGWLKPYIHAGTQYVITSELDDDDGIFSGFTQYVYDHLIDLKNKGKLPPVLFFGCKKAMMWDFFHSKNAPFGYKKPYADYFAMPVSVGHSLCCKFPEIDLSVKNFHHPHFDYLGMSESELQTANPKIAKPNKLKKNFLKELAAKSSLDWDGVLNKNTNFHVINTQNPQAVVINHFDNIQHARIFTNHKLREPVRDENTFPGITIDLTNTSNYIKPYKRSLLMLNRAIKNAILYNPLELRGMGFTYLLKDKIKRLKDSVVGVCRLPK